MITLLVTGSEPGLQAKDSDGNWHDVPCNAGYITINSGDNALKGNTRVLSINTASGNQSEDQENRSRYSMPLFVHPRPEVQLDDNQDRRGVS